MNNSHAAQSLLPLRSEAPGRSFRAREFLAHRHEAPRAIWLIEDGWAARFKLLRDGRRHISRFYAPGDLCDLSWLVTDAADQSVVALTSVRAARLDRQRLDTRMGIDPDLSVTVARDALAELRAQAEWLITLGCKSACEKIAHFLCELYVRLERRGQAKEHICDFPLSQQDVADFTGMTAVHACRTLRELREEAVIELRRRRLRIVDFAKLARIGSFDAHYLDAEFEDAPSPRGPFAAPASALSATN